MDVHIRVGTVAEADSLLQIADVLQQQHHVRLAAFINVQPLHPVGDPPPLTPEFFDAVEQRYRGRILSCIADYNVPRGLRYSPEDLAAWQKRGVVGYDIWFPVVIGPKPPDPDTFTIHAPDYPGIDTLANEPVFAAMEQLGLVGTCVHIGQPHPRRWKDPVHYWTAIQSWLRVLDRHPRMVVVMGHMMNLFYTDEQLDFLAWVLETHPRVHVEFGGRFGDFKAMRRDHLRDFMIRYADRVLFGSCGVGGSSSKIREQMVAKYLYGFRLLESDGLVSNGNGPPERGLGLPAGVLEKIYHRNAVRLFPRLEAALR